MNDKLVLDIGCGSGRLTFALSPFARKAVGIDISPSEIEKAKETARAKGADNVEFYVADAEAIDYRDVLGEEIDVVCSNLCMSAEIIKRSSKALSAGRPFVFACFHSDQLKELGGSRFSFGEGEMKGLLEAAGFDVEYLGVESWTIDLPKGGDELRTKIGSYDWAKRRWDMIMRYVRDGGKTLTQSRLIVKARKM